MIALNRFRMPLPVMLALGVLFWAAFLATLIALVPR